MALHNRLLGKKVFQEIQTGKRLWRKQSDWVEVLEVLVMPPWQNVGSHFFTGSCQTPVKTAYLALMPACFSTAIKTKVASNNWTFLAVLRCYWHKSGNCFT